VALGAVGLFTALFSVALLLGSRGRTLDGAPEPDVVAVEDGGAAVRRGFRHVLLAGGLDNGTRGAGLTFLPFVLADKGFSAADISALFALIFAAGAAGKFACGWMTDRWGIVAVIVVTESVTAAALVAILLGPAWAAIPLAVVFGFALNGTSSALNVGVAQFVPRARRASGFGTYFTVALLSSAVAPLAYGLLGDIAGLTAVFVVMAALTLAVIPAILPVRRQLGAAHGAHGA
jgi:MFS family permease